MSTEALTINVDESLATQADVAAMTAELKAEISGLDLKFTTEIASVRTEIAELETKLTAKIAAVETMMANDRAELIRWIVASFVGNVVTMITIAKFFAHP